MIRTRDEYKASLQDRREVCNSGERVKNVITHPMFKPLVDIRERIYDMRHDAAGISDQVLEKTTMQVTGQSAFLGTTAAAVNAF